MARILLAEDDEDIATLVQFKLEEAGHVVHAVGDGAAAIARVEEGGIELAILDVMMPKVDGFEAARSIAARPDAPSILMLTARGREEDIEEAFGAGVDDYLVKPFSPRELLSRVERLLR